MKRIYIVIVLTAIFAGIFAGCEDQEDTWDDYAGNGRIRYTGNVRMFLWNWDGRVWLFLGKIRWIRIGKIS